MALLSDLDLESLIETAPDVVMKADGQLTPYDRLIYFWAAREFYRGHGTIVDAGALVGGTTCIFAEGLRLNPAFTGGAAPIHVYDLFEDSAAGYSAQLLKGWYDDHADTSEPYDFEKHFRRNTAPYAELIQVHKGDIAQQAYDDARGIEVLSIDVAKSADLMLSVARTFFPRLIPGRSIILHQDYVFPYQPWLHIAMELMSDLLDKVYDPPNHCTSVFVARRPITVADVEARLGQSGADYYHLGNVGALHEAIARARPGYGKFIHTAALAYFHLVMGQKKTASMIAIRMMDEFGATRTMLRSAALAAFLENDLGIDIESLCG